MRTFEVGKAFAVELRHGRGGDAAESPDAANEEGSRYGVAYETDHTTVPYEQFAVI